MRTWIIPLLLIGAGGGSLHPALAASLITFRVTVPEAVADGEHIYLAGNFQGWQPGSTGHRLTRIEDKIWEISLSLPPGQAIEFKFTRGSWNKVEKGARGEEIGNRRHKVGPDDQTLELEVAMWADNPAAGGGEAGKQASTITGNVQSITVPGFLNGRRVWVYLPPNYATESSRRFPVLYMLDGQNVFDAATSFVGEWEVDETLEKLIPAGEVAPLMVVAVDNGGHSRIDEYTPWPDKCLREGRGGRAAAHMQAIIEILKPHIDQEYRTLPGREDTGFAGSSLGGLMSLYAAFFHGDVFGRIGAFSPSLWWDGCRMTNCITGLPKPDCRLYTDMGGLESFQFEDIDMNETDDSLDRLRVLKAVLTGRGFREGHDLMVVEAPGAVHNEGAWARRFPGAMRFLFPPE
jgi:predicted alpha/beta superfamily hydrolase